MLHQAVFVLKTRREDGHLLGQEVECRSVLTELAPARQHHSEHEDAIDPNRPRISNETSMTDATVVGARSIDPKVLKHIVDDSLIRVARGLAQKRDGGDRARTAVAPDNVVALLNVVVQPGAVVVAQSVIPGDAVKLGQREHEDAGPQSQICSSAGCSSIQRRAMSVAKATCSDSGARRVA